MTLEDLVVNNMFPRKAQKEGEYWVKCPFCGDEKYRMGINVISGLAHCFRASCNIAFTDRHKLFRALSEIFNSTERMDDARVRKVKKPQKTIGPQSLPREFEALYSDPLDDDIHLQAMRYLEKRGVTWDQIKKHKLGFCAVGDYAWRIIIPIYRKGKVVAFTGRNFAEAEVDPKYKNSPGSKYLYNLPQGAKKDVCVLVEGPFDVWAIERAVANVDVLGRLGTGLTKSATQDLTNYDEIILWPDPDKGGCDLAASAAKSLTLKGRKVSVIMPDDDDVDPGKLGVTKEGLVEIAYKIRTRVTWSEHVSLKLKHFAAFV